MNQLERLNITIFFILVIFLYFIGIAFVIAPIKVQQVSYQGHTMLQYSKLDIPVSVCHSPECKKCLQVFD